MGQILAQYKFMIVGAAILIALGVWWGLSSTPSDTSALSTEVVSGPGQEVVDTLLTLRAIKLDGAIFTQPAFAALRDFSTQIVPEPVGRPNPFAPLDGKSVGATSGTVSASQEAATKAASPKAPPAKAGAR